MLINESDFTWESEDKICLAEALFECGCMSTSDARALVLKQLPPTVTIHNSAPPGIILELVSIVGTCLEYGVLDKLLYIVRKLEGETDKRRRLDRVVYWASFPTIMLNKERLHALRSNLDGTKFPWTKETLLKVYKESAQPGPHAQQPQGDNIAKLLDNILYTLADTPTQPSQDSRIFPIIEFVERLAANAHPSPLADKLREWVDTTCSSHDNDAEALRRKIATPTNPPENLVPYLLVVLKPENKSASQLEIRAWIWFSRENSIPLICDKAKQSFTINAGIQALPGVIERLLEVSFYTLNGNTKGLVIEMFVPYQLLTRKANDWPIQGERMPHPLRHIDGINADNWPIKAGIQLLTNLGRKYPITVRSYDRTYDYFPHLWDSWKGKWDQFQAFANISYDEPIAWLCRTDEDDLRDFHDKLARTNVIGAVSLFAPSTVPPIKNQNIILAILNAGLPIVFWVRCPIDNAEQDYRALLVAEQLADLPRMLWERRKSEQSDLWNQVTLLWDDPNRLPPDHDFTNQLARPYQVGE